MHIKAHKIINFTIITLLFLIFTSCASAQTETANIQISLTQEEKDWLHNNPIIKTGSDPYWEPVEFIDKKGERRGISADYLKEFEKILGIKFEFSSAPSWAALIKEAKAGKIQLMSNVSVTEERKTFLIFSESYISLPVLIYTRNEIPFVPDINAIKDKKIAIVKDYAVQGWLHEDYPNLKPILCKNTEDALIKLKNGEVFAYIGDLVTTGYVIRQSGYLSLKVAGRTKYAYNGSIGVAKHEPVLAGIIQKALDAIPVHKKKAIYHKWIGKGYTPPFNYTFLWKITFLISIIIIFFIYSNIRLRNAVKRRTKELSDSEAQYRTLFESANDAMFIATKDNVFLKCNPKAVQMFEMESEKDLKGTTPGTFSAEFQLDGQRSEKKAAEIVKEVLKGNKTSAFLWKNRTKNGKEFYTEISLSPIYINNELCVLSILRDINERREMQKKIEEEQRFATALINAIPGEFFVWTENAEIIRWNKAMEEKSKFSGEEIKKMSMLQWFKKEEHTMIQEAVAKCLRDGFASCEANPLNKEGTTTPTFYTACRLNLDNKRYLVGIGLDITEQKKTQKALIKAKEKAEEADKLKTAFLASLSHEIRTPMNGILGFSELLKDGSMSKAEQKEYISIIERSGKRMLSIINDLIDISKIESGHLTLDKIPTSINKLLDEVYTFFKPQSEQMGLKFTCFKSLAESDSIIDIDKGKIIQVLTNLINNAFKFTNKGEISFGYDLNQGKLEFHVKDTGIGIASDMQALVFERFRQANLEISKKHEGSGLGLSISKAFVEKHGGKMWLDSTEGEGSTFYFSLPYEPSAEKSRTSQKKHTLPIPAGISIMIAEDDDTSHMLLNKILAKGDFKIFHAYNGQEAVDILEQKNKIDLILMDLKMPEMNGITATKIIKEKFPNLPIVAQSAFSHDADIRKAVDAGCDGFISKPIDQDELFAAINRLIKDQK